MKLCFRFLAFVMLLLSPILADAQCASCKAVAESSMEAGSSAAIGINNGVLYMLFMPFIFAAVFYYIYKRRQKYLRQFGEEI